MTAPLWGYLAIVKQLFKALSSASVYLSIAAMLAGCAGANVAVQTTRLPVPVVEPLPISVAIHLSDELRNFSHEEAIRDYGTFRISVGSAQDLMFSNLAKGLFANHRFVSAAEASVAIDASSTEGTDTAGNDEVDKVVAKVAAELAAATLNPADLSSLSSDPSSPLGAVNAILVPTIGELQFSIPAQTKSDFYEVWLRYNFKLLSPDGSAIAEWPMQAYGRANKRNYGFLEDTENGALQEAARVALRDAMAVFTFKFQRVPKVKQWLQQYTGTDTQSPPAANSSNSTIESELNSTLDTSGESGGYE